jgi:hypothetical protein
MRANKSAKEGKHTLLLCIGLEARNNTEPMLCLRRLMNDMSSCVTPPTIAAAVKRYVRLTLFLRDLKMIIVRQGTNHYYELPRIALA